MSRVIAETPRLALDELTLRRDEAFVLQLLNEPGFLQNIGDRGVSDVTSAAAYIGRQQQCYAQQGFGLWRVSLRGTGTVVGICGLVRRPGLNLPDLGYAILQSHAGQGYATEAAAATLAHAGGPLAIDRLAAVTKPANAASDRVLQKLGFTFHELIELPGSAQPSRYFTLRLNPDAATPGLPT